MSNLSNFLGGSIFTNTKNYLLPRTSTFTSVTSPLSWNSNDVDMIIINSQGSSFTINEDSGSPIDGQRFLLRVRSNTTSVSVTFTGTVSKGFRPVGTSLQISGANFSYALTNGKVCYFGLSYNSSDSFWDIIAISEQTI